MRSSHISNSSENVVHVQIKIMCFFLLSEQISLSTQESVGAMFNWFAFILLSLAPRGRFLIALIILNFNDLPSARVEIFLSHYSAGGEERAHLCIIQRQGEILSLPFSSPRRIHPQSRTRSTPARSLNAHTLAEESSFFANCRRL